MAKKKAETKPNTLEEVSPKAAPSEATDASKEASAAPSGAGLAVGPKFNPYVRLAGEKGGTEQADTTPIRQSYEEIQESAKGPGADEWREADRLRANLSATYQSLLEDERYAAEYKSRRAWEEYAKARAKIEALVPEARQKMLRSAEGLERLSIPTSEGESLVTRDTDKLLLTAHERSRIQGRLEHMERAGFSKKLGEQVLKVNPVDILREEYERGLDQGGPGGGACVRAVYELCRDYDYDIDSVVAGRRKHYHHGALEDAQRARMRVNLIARSVPEPPFPHPNQLRQAAERTGTYGKGAAKAFVPQQRGMIFPKRRSSHWQ